MRFTNTGTLLTAPRRSRATSCPRPAMCDDAALAHVREADRLRLLIETGIAISSELSLDGTLERIVEASALVTGARYAALGVIDRTGTGLERFVTHGIDAETRAN